MKISITLTLDSWVAGFVYSLLAQHLWAVAMPSLKLAAMLVGGFAAA